MNKLKKGLILKIAIVFTLAFTLFAIPRWKKWFPPNPYNLNYTKVAKLGKILDTGTSPDNQKTFLITLGSRSCPACTQLYKTMEQYNKLAKDKKVEDGFVPYWTTDLDLEPQDEVGQFAYEYILDNEYRRWDGTAGTFKSLSDIATPTTWFVKNGKVKEIILGTTLKVEDVIEYVKNS